MHDAEMQRILAGAGGNEAMRQEMVAWLRGLADWETFFTGTFRSVHGLDGAIGAFRRFYRRTLRGVPCFAAWEGNPSGDGGYHVHAICGRVWRRGVWQVWFALHGRNACLPIEDIGAVKGYVAKYVWKKNTWWEPLGISGRVFLELENVVDDVETRPAGHSMSLG